MNDDCSEIAGHLRTVHFSLVLVCVLAGLSLSAQSPSKLDTVRNQLEQVSRIKANWMTWTKRFGTEQVTWLQNQGLLSSAKIPGEIYFPAEELKRENLPQGEEGWTARPYYSPVYLYLSVNLPAGPRHEILGRGWPRENEIELVPGGYEAVGNPKLDTLDDFRHFWNAAETMVAFVLKELSPDAYLVSNGHVTTTLHWTRTPKRQGSQIPLARMGIGSREHGDQCNGLGNLFSSRWRSKFNVLFCGQAPERANKSASQILVLPAVYQDQHVPISLRVWLAEHFKFPAVGNRFEETFANLNDFVKKNPKMEFADVSRLLQSELEREKSSEKIELLGLRFSEGDLANWGTGVIAVIQLYFWLHLRVLSSRLTAGNSHMKVAWIGIYSDIYSRIVSILTACALPVGVMLYTITTTGFSLFALFTFTIGILLAFVAGFLLTRIATQSATNQKPRTREPHL